MAYGLEFQFVENDPTYRDGYVYITRKGPKVDDVIFGSIVREWNGGLFPIGYQYRVILGFRDVKSGNPYGKAGIKTLAAAKEEAMKMLKHIFYDNRGEQA